MAQTQQMEIADPWIARHGTSVLLNVSNGPAGSDVIHTAVKEIYGNTEHPIRFRIGNGGAGYTGILRDLCEEYIRTHGDDFSIAWISNHSRHSQIALLADIVQVALTYEPENEDISIEEGWARRVCRAFNDHFILVGPEVSIDSSSIGAALGNIASTNIERAASTAGSLLFHTRGDGSATFSRELLLWQAAGVETRGAKWIKTYPLTPYEALVKAEEEKAFLLTDRATFLTAKQDEKIPSLRVHVEGGVQLLNPCSALVGAGTADKPDESRKSAASFAEWLSSSTAQDIVRNYGRAWKLGKPLFTTAAQEEFEDCDRLTGDL